MRKRTRQGIGLIVTGQSHRAGIVLLLLILLAVGTVGCGQAESFVGAQAADSRGEILFVANHNVMRWSEDGIEQLTRDVYAQSPTWAPAADRFAYVQVREGYSEIVIARRDGETLLQVTDNNSGFELYSEEHVYNAAWAFDPDWSPTGEELVFTSDKGGLDLFSRPLYIWIAEGFEIPPYPLPASLDIALSQESPSYAPDGDNIAFSVRVDDGTGRRVTEIWTLNLETGLWEPRVAGAESAYDPDWSPDGRHIAYIQRTGESNDVWIVPVDGGEPYQLTDVGTAAEPVWSPDGSQIAFMRVVDGAFEVWVVDVTEGEDGRLVASDPERLFTAENIDAQSGLSWIARR